LGRYPRLKRVCQNSDGTRVSPCKIKFIAQNRTLLRFQGAGRVIRFPHFSDFRVLTHSLKLWAIFGHPPGTSFLVRQEIRLKAKTTFASGGAAYGGGV
jgi:hypothetical protein